MKFFIIRPEVPAGIGENSQLERILGTPLKVIKLHLVFEDCPDSELMKTSPVFYVTEKLKAGLLNSDLTGIDSFETFEVSKSENFEEKYPNKVLPAFYWFKINGVAKQTDFGVELGKLIISEKAKTFLEGYNLNTANITEIKSHSPS